jgi:ABC-type Fe3+-hydroxamate transport system substrate-binding protein
MRDKRAKFVELATARVNRVIKELRLVGNLSNKSSYEYTEEDGKKILRALQRELDALKGRFGEQGAGNDTTFTL